MDTIMKLIFIYVAIMIILTIFCIIKECFFLAFVAMVISLISGALGIIYMIDKKDKCN